MNINIIHDVIKDKTGIRGYWKDNTGKLYKDNILLRYVDNARLEDVKLELFNKGEKGIFYKVMNTAIIEDTQGNRQYLNTKTLLKYKHIKPSLFKALLKKYTGFTVYKNKGYYLIEIWQE